jgi:hypothetical protein
VNSSWQEDVFQKEDLDSQDMERSLNWGDELLAMKRMFSKMYLLL